MKITSETAAALGEKLATLDLEPEEAVLLATMLEDDAEVSGFNNREEIKVTYLPAVQAPVRNKWIDVLGSNVYTKIEWV